MPRQAELLEVRAHRLGRVAGIAQRRDRRALGALRQLLAVVADHEPVVDDLRGRRPERAMERRVQLLVRPVIRAANHVRDPEVGVVDDAREVERRRLVVPPEHHALEALRQPGGPRRLEMASRARALPHRSLVPGDPEPGQVAEHALLAAGHVPRRVGVVDAQQQPVAEPAVRDRAERVADVQRARRARREPDPCHAENLSCSHAASRRARPRSRAVPRTASADPPRDSARPRPDHRRLLRLGGPERVDESGNAARECPLQRRRAGARRGRRVLPRLHPRLDPHPRGVGIDVPYRVALQAEMVSMLAKYLPGGVWTPAARAVALRRDAGVTDTPTVLASIFVEAALSAISGVIVFVVSLAWVRGVDAPLPWLILFAVLLSSLLHPRVFRPLSRRAAEAVRSRRDRAAAVPRHDRAAPLLLRHVADRRPRRLLPAAERRRLAGLVDDPVPRRRLRGRRDRRRARDLRARPGSGCAKRRCTACCSRSRAPGRRSA